MRWPAVNQEVGERDRRNAEDLEDEEEGVAGAVLLGPGTWGFWGQEQRDGHSVRPPPVLLSRQLAWELGD